MPCTPSGWQQVFAAIVIILAFTAGTALMMWLGEQINQKGIGNGISILLFAGIVATDAAHIGQLSQLYLSCDGRIRPTMDKYYAFVPLFVVLFLAVIWVIVFMNDAERRIPVQYAKRVVGRKMYGGQSTHIPIKVTMSGVMPIIFAASILSIPEHHRSSSWTPERRASGSRSLMHSLPRAGSTRYLYFLLIIAVRVLLCDHPV